MRIASTIETVSDSASGLGSFVDNEVRATWRSKSRSTACSTLKVSRNFFLVCIERGKLRSWLQFWRFRNLQ